MKKSFTLFILAAAAIVSACSGGKSGANAVNVFNGTDFHGHTYPGATTPFGLVQLSPDTRTYGWDGCSGYHYSDTAILGFSHTHLSGTGCADLGDFLFTPGLGEVGPLPFSHSDETASPGYYRVKFPAGITAELTATAHAGVHRYTFKGKGTPRILVDAVHSIGTGTTAIESDVTAVGQQEISGHRLVQGWAEGRDIYMNASFSVPFEADETEPGKLLLTFPEGTREITVVTGLSYTSVPAARKNRESEVPTPDFKLVRKAAEAEWTSALGRIRVSGGPADRFYTCFYHTFACPNLYGDAGDKPFYSTLSIWDTYRSWNPLQTILDPAFVNDMINSMLDMFDSWGELPIWPLGYYDTHTMTGYHSVSIIADAWLRGIRGFDGEKALKAMVTSSNKNRDNNSALYVKYGYIPSDLKREAVSQTLEYAYDDWCIARMAESLGRKDIAEEYDARALSYRNLFDASTGFFRGKTTDGNWVAPFDPLSSTRDYTEGIPWQYRFFVPHDPAGEVCLMGGVEATYAALDSLFTYDERSDKVDIADISGYMGQYAHGNEPSHHQAFLFNWLGKPSRSHEIVRSLLEEMYSTAPDGVSGNEDCGQMSAWYILSSLGIYPVCPGSGQYILSAPLFKRADISLGNGKVLTVKADHPERPYIGKVTLNGVALDRLYVTYDEIMAGGELRFFLSAKPDASWDALPAPYSLSTEPFVSAPAVAEDLSLFKESTPVNIISRTEGAEVRYTLDGSDPCETSPLYTGPFVLDRSATVKARAFKDGMQPSDIATVKAVKAVYSRPSYPEIMQPGCRYTYHRGIFSETADVLASPVDTRGVLAEPSIEEAPDEDHFGYIFTGYIDVPEKGIYAFSLTSDDGAVLDIDGIRVVNNDGSHSAITTFGRIPLEAGLHSYRLIYLEDYEGEHLSWGWRAENETRFSRIPSDRLFYK